jgi:hypothetical protein
MHGIIDYAYGAMLVALPFLLGWDDRAKRLSVGAGIATIGMSMITNYELGLFRLLPMKAHLAMDAVETSMLMSAPRMLDGSGGQGAARALAVFGAAGATVGAMTETESTLERHQLAAPPSLTS